MREQVERLFAHRGGRRELLDLLVRDNRGAQMCLHGLDLQLRKRLRINPDRSAVQGLRPAEGLKPHGIALVAVHDLDTLETVAVVLVEAEI